MDNIKIIVASDSIGETAELVARAGVSQFNPKQCKHEFLRYPYIESFENVDEVIQVAKDTNAIIVYTLIKPEIKKYMISKVNEHALKSVDIMGPLMELLSNSIEETPYYEPGMVQRLNDAYFKRLMQSNLLLNTMTEKILKDCRKQILCYLAFQEHQNTFISIFST